MVRNFAIAALLSFACAKTVPAAAGIGEPCVGNGDCAAGFLCASSRCALPANLGGCEPNALRCNGADVEQCDGSGLNWQHVSTCATGCTAGQCRPQVCTPGALRCEGDAAEACSPAGDAWALVQECATHCNPDTGRCKSPACAPFSALCDPSGANNVMVCDAYGSGYALTACSADRICAAGVCVPSSAGCTTGDVRCNGRDAQACVAGAPGTTQWQTRETCLSACNGGVCDGAGACAGVALHAAVAVAPADGKSTVLFYSDPIASADGLALPDGQEFTVGVTSAGAATDAAVASADADDSLPGTQVVSAGGRVHFAVLAPLAASGDVLVTASAHLAAGASCGSSAQLTFSAGPSQGVLVAQDFTSGSSEVAGGADWNTPREALVASFPLPVGDGRDGPLTVAAGTSLDLSATTLAPAYRVLALGASSARIDTTLPTLSGGDEVVLWDAQGTASASANAGAYEFLTVQSVSADTIAFTSPIKGYYGSAADQATTTQHVVLQRIPHLSSLTVASAATLTGPAWDGNVGGLLFLRVSGSAAIQGDVSMDGKGFRGATTTGVFGEGYIGQASGGGGGFNGSGGTYTYGSSSLGVLFFGAGAGCGSSCTADAGRGGGAIVVVAHDLSMQTPGATSWAGKVHALGKSGGSGAGGSVWLAAGSMVLGDGAAGSISANGAGSGGAGRVRLDFLASDVNGVTCARTATPGSCRLGASGPLAAQSPPAYVIDAASATNIQVAKLELALGAPAGAVYRASATDPPTFSTPLLQGDSVNFGQGASPSVGKKFRWRAELTPDPGTAQLLLGLQWSLQIQ